MWPLSKRKGSFGKHIEPAAIQKMEWKVFEKNEAVLNFNPTVPQREALNWLCSLRSCTRNDLLLHLAFRHLYGAAALEGLKEYVTKKDGLGHRDELLRIDALLHDYSKTLNAEESNPKEFDKDQFSENAHLGDDISQEDGVARFSRPRDLVRKIDEEHIGAVAPDVGPMILRLPTKMLEDLHSVAAAHGLEIATYFKKLLIVELDGETRHTFWQKAHGKIG